MMRDGTKVVVVVVVVVLSSIVKSKYSDTVMAIMRRWRR